MQPLLEQDYYKLLEVPRTGTPQQIERAYRIARVTYHPGSTATYSIFGTEESAAILRRIEEAYAVLSDTRLRRDYDARLRQAGEQAPPESEARPRMVAGERVEVASPVEPHPSKRPHRAAEPVPDVDLDEALEPPDGVYDGPVLRRIRMSLGIELDEISSLTKINEPYLQNIEANDYDALPAAVYVRGFVKEFARCIGLDSASVAETYIKRLEAHRGARA